MCGHSFHPRHAKTACPGGPGFPPQARKDRVPRGPRFWRNGRVGFSSLVYTISKNALDQIFRSCRAKQNSFDLRQYMIIRFHRLPGQQGTVGVAKTLEHLRQFIVALQNSPHPILHLVLNHLLG